jgi:hypothetical protein
VGASVSMTWIFSTKGLSRSLGVKVAVNTPET